VAKKHVFDSFECAIQLVAPEYDHCGCKIIGQGVEGGGKMFCCADCVRESGQRQVRDRG